jgi:hypothetical protein
MGWWANLTGKASPVEQVIEPQRIGGDPTLTDGDRLDRHIWRFTLALEQCEKPDKRKELQAWLDYYSNLKSAQRRLEAAL